MIERTTVARQGWVGVAREQRQPRAPLRFEAVRLSGLTPEKALAMSDDLLLQLLEERIGQRKLFALLGGELQPSSPRPDSSWFQTSRIVGVHPRITRTYLDMVKYALTCPEEALHLLPLQEAGAGNSLYAPASWNINGEFLNDTLTKKGLKTPEMQLKFVVSALHALGKSVGFDIQPHTDRFSETVFAHPDFFEWIRLDPTRTQEASNADSLHQEVSQAILAFLAKEGDTLGRPVALENFFSEATPETTRERILFGPKDQPALRTQRRVQLMNWVRSQGYETIASPNFYHARPVRFLKMNNDDQGNTWATFEAKTDISTPFPQTFSVFGSITPFKWFHTRDGVPDLKAPNLKVWDYYADKIVALQQEYGLDFFRVDRPYIPLRTIKPGDPLSPLGTPYPENFWAYVKERVAQNNPSIATLAEAFFDPNSCGRDDPFLNIESGRFDVALGSLQYQQVDGEFLGKVKEKNMIGLNRPVTFRIANTMMTADSDKPKFNFMYPGPLANSIRAFVGMLLNQPSYMGMGFETRDPQPTADANRYTCHYIDYDLNGQGKYFLWGKNTAFLRLMNRMRQASAGMSEMIRRASHYWLNAGDGTPQVSSHLGAWSYYSPQKGLEALCVLNTSLKPTAESVWVDNPLTTIPTLSMRGDEAVTLAPVFSTAVETANLPRLSTLVISRGKPLKLTRLAPGEGRVYRVVKSRES